MKIRELPWDAMNVHRGMKNTLLFLAQPITNHSLAMVVVDKLTCKLAWISRDKVRESNLVYRLELRYRSEHDLGTSYRDVRWKAAA